MLIANWELLKNYFHELTKYIFIILYKAFVRPILEYCCITWAPHFIKDHKEIEKIQKRLVKSISLLPYGEIEEIEFDYSLL